MAFKAFQDSAAVDLYGIHYFTGWPRADRSSMVPVWFAFSFKSRGYASGDAGDADDRGARNLPACMKAGS